MKTIILTISFFIGGTLILLGQPSHWFPKDFLDTASNWKSIQFPEDRSCAIQSVRVIQKNDGYTFQLKTNATEEFVNYKQKVVKRGKKIYVDFFEDLIVSPSGRFSDSFASKAKYSLEYLPDQELIVKLKFDEIERHKVFCNGKPLKEIKNIDFDLAMYFIVSSQYLLTDSSRKILKINSSGEFSESIYGVGGIVIVGQLPNPGNGFLNAYLCDGKSSNGVIKLIVFFSSEKLIFKEYNRELKTIGQELFSLKRIAVD
jgi:hypothetical protein